MLAFKYHYCFSYYHRAVRGSGNDVNWNIYKEAFRERIFSTHREAWKGTTECETVKPCPLKKTQNKFSHPDGSLEHPRYMANFPMHRVRTILEISQKSVHTFNRNLANKGKLFRNINNKILDPFGDFPTPFLPNHQIFRQSVLVSCPI